nr:unnamed protein product [Callosobruchus analis]
MGNVTRMIMRPPGHSGKAKKGHLCFDASFETGNLGKVDLINEYEYDISIRPDSCNPKLRFWFNFTVDNVKQDQRVIFNVVNISKEKNLLMDNLTPLVKSSSRQKWQRIPKQHVYYAKSPLHHNHYILSFSFAFDKEDDVFQFCLAPPYSYSRLQTFLNLLEVKASHLDGSFKRELLANSVQKRRLDLITIGSLDPEEPKPRRRVIAIMARVHPGESPASFVCQGFTGASVSSNSIASTLRKYVIFKVIPMMNPDGVFIGNYRSTAMGIDLNRSWHLCNPWCHPTIKATRDVLTTIDKSKELQLDFVVDIHAHSSLKGCFVYGNTYEDVYRYERHILFPKLLSTVADDYAQSNTMFNSDVNKSGSARRFLCSILSDKVNCYSFEVSIFGYKLKGSEITIPYTEESYMRCGRNLVRTFLEYYHNTGAIPIQLSSEIGEKKRRAFTNQVKRRNKERHQRPMTSRTLAQLHFQNLRIADFSDTSASADDDYYNSSRNAESMRDQASKSLDQSFYRSNSPLPTKYVVLPEPSLSIIDFNKEYIERVPITSKKNKRY